jgi:hypothetical protein
MNVQEKIRYGCYKTKLSYPDPQNYPPLGSHDPEFRKAREEWYADNTRLERVVFKEDLCKAHGVEGNPKADLCFNLAWEHGHAAGLSEVEGYFSEFVELIK